MDGSAAGGSHAAAKAFVRLAILVDAKNQAPLGGDVARGAPGEPCWVEGAVRDTAELADMDIGIKALGTCPMRTLKRGEGLRDAPVAFGGVVFVPGDILHADPDGLAVLPVDEEEG